MRKLLLTATCIFWLQGPASAGEPPLSGEALTEAVAGKTILLETPLGALPISYRPDGTMSGQARELAHLVGSNRDNGTWWVNRDKLCQRWTKWLDGKSYCFTLRKEGRTVHWTRNDGQSGIATIAR